MRCLYFRRLSIVTVAVIGSWNYGQAATIVSNLSEAVDGTGTVYGSGPPQYYAQEFATGSQNMQLADIIAALGDSTQPYTASAELVSNSGGLPSSTVLTTFTVPAISMAYSNLTFTPNSTVALNANTDYWFVLGATGDGEYSWQYTNTLNAALPDYAVSNDGGMTWSVGNPPGPFLIQVDSGAASTVPEPSSFSMIGLLGIGFVAAIGARRFTASRRNRTL